jgi:hypothetical protein
LLERVGKQGAGFVVIRFGKDQVAERLSDKAELAFSEVSARSC